MTVAILKCPALLVAFRSLICVIERSFRLPRVDQLFVGGTITRPTIEGLGIMNGMEDT